MVSVVGFGVDVTLKKKGSLKGRVVSVKDKVLTLNDGELCLSR